MNDIFIIRDYDSKEIMYIFLTDSAAGCKKALENIDNLTEDDAVNMDHLAYVKYTNHWIEAFKILCQSMNIKLKEAQAVESYNY